MIQSQISTLLFHAVPKNQMLSSGAITGIVLAVIAVAVVFCITVINVVIIIESKEIL